jgi:hypothetical protein
MLSRVSVHIRRYVSLMRDLEITKDLTTIYEPAP